MHSTKKILHPLCSTTTILGLLKNVYNLDSSHFYLFVERQKIGSCPAAILSPDPTLASQDPRHTHSHTQTNSGTKRRAHVAPNTTAAGPAAQTLCCQLDLYR